MNKLGLSAGRPSENKKTAAQAAARTRENHGLIIAGCNAELKDIFGRPGSFLQNPAHTSKHS